MCQLIRPDCSIKYIGETGQSYISHFKEHLQWCHCGNNRCTFAHHLMYCGKAMNTKGQVTEIIYTVYRAGGNMHTVDSFNVTWKRGKTRLTTGAS